MKKLLIEAAAVLLNISNKLSNNSESVYVRNPDSHLGEAEMCEDACVLLEEMKILKEILMRHPDQ